MSILIKNAHVITMDDHWSEYEHADILVEGSKITAIGTNLAQARDPGLRVIDASGKLAMPGLVNGHVHSPGNFARGSLDSLPLEIFMLYEVPPLSEKPPDFRTNYIRTMLGNIEMLKLGITAVHDDAFYVPFPTPEAIDGLMQSYVDSGLRCVATLDQPNVLEYEKYPFLFDLLPESIRENMEKAPLMSSQELLALYHYFIEKWNNQCDGRVKVGVSVSSPQRVKLDYFGALSDLSRQYDLPFDIHILETKLQRVLGEVKYGKSLVRFVNDLGFLDERVMVIHAIWVDDFDIDLMAGAGCSVAHNPVCNLRLGSGVMNFRRLKNAGINICLGSDEACSDDSHNMWVAAKVAGLIHNITDPEYRNWPKAQEILWALIHGGARAMRNEGKTGVLAPGYEADLILVDLNSFSFTPLNDIYRQLVYCETGSSVVLTMVAGNIVMENGKILTVDEEAIKAEAREMMREYRQEMEKTRVAASQLEPYYREMYRRCAAMEVGMNRWVNYRQ
ncbi:MAG: amidohydrolase family protein [Anaerolineales bacterium]|nr:amidohydrolase family protein [Anaerolineales bacterium]